MNLTAEQQAAVNHQLAHARVVAVAGAGKTATLVHYIAKQIGAVTPSMTLVLMYNRAAQEAFRQRLHQLCGSHNSLPQVRTFHALGLSIYKRMINDGWLPTKQLQPLSETVIELQLKQLLQANPKARALVDGPAQLQEWVETCRQFIVLVKSDIQPAQTVLERLALNRGEEVLLETFNRFERWRHQQQAITYDDMLYDPAHVFLLQPQSRYAFADVFDEILVDEYQDINPIQHFLLQVIAGKRAQVMVIGDPDQTIYEFRGSSPLFITDHFARDFAAPTTYCLTRTFRFGHVLALCANQLISHNKVREPILTISAESTPKSKINIAQCDDHGCKIAMAIKRLHSKGGAYNGMAVLCRLWSYIRPVELALMAEGIPYRIEGEQSILQRAEIRPLLHCLDLISGAFFNYQEEQKKQALFELLTTPPLKIAHAVIRRICATWASTIAPGQLRQTFQLALPHNLTPYQQRTFALVADALHQLTDKSCAVALHRYATILDIAMRLRDGALNPEKGEEQARTVNAFLQFLTTTPVHAAADVRSILQQMQNNQQPAATDAITLTTIHRSKGLEWPVIFLPNLAEGHLPCTALNGRGAEQKPIESERRLMYVAITRAQKQLFITVPSSSCSARTSRFIGEMNVPLSQDLGDAIHQAQERVILTQAPGSVVTEYLNQLSKAPELELQLSPVSTRQSYGPEENHWTVGARVQHTVLGLGHIRRLDDRRIDIEFDDGKIRAFVSDIARPHLSLACEV